MVSTCWNAGVEPGKHPPICGKSSAFLSSSPCGILMGIFKPLTDTVKPKFVEAD